MIVAPPKVGKTTLLKKVANAISQNNPEVELWLSIRDGSADILQMWTELHRKMS